MFSLLLQEHELVLLTTALSGTRPVQRLQLSYSVAHNKCDLFCCYKTMSPKVVSQSRLPLQHSCFFSWLRRSKKKCSIAFTVQVIGMLEKQQHQTKSGAGDKLDSKETVRDLHPTQGTTRQVQLSGAANCIHICSCLQSILCRQGRDLGYPGREKGQPCTSYLFLTKTAH